MTQTTRPPAARAKCEKISGGLIRRPGCRAWPRPPFLSQRPSIVSPPPAVRTHVTSAAHSISYLLDLPLTLRTRGDRAAFARALISSPGGGRSSPPVRATEHAHPVHKNDRAPEPSARRQDDETGQAEDKAPRRDVPLLVSGVLAPSRQRKERHGRKHCREVKGGRPPPRG